MRSVLVAALVARMTVAGGAGAGIERAEERRQAGSGWDDVRRHFSSLQKEFSTLENEFQQARERHRQEAEQQQPQPEPSGGQR
jgi:hypothetical protein